MSNIFNKNAQKLTIFVKFPYKVLISIKKEGINPSFSLSIGLNYARV